MSDTSDDMECAAAEIFCGGCEKHFTDCECEICDNCEKPIGHNDECVSVRYGFICLRCAGY
jgi:hypothetical protein